MFTLCVFLPTNVPGTRPSLFYATPSGLLGTMDKNGMDVWRQRVLTDLKQRNKREARGFVELIASRKNEALRSAACHNLREDV